MILKAVILLWLASFALSLLAKAQGRVWMMRLFVGGFCLLLLGIFMKIISRIL